MSYVLYNLGHIIVMACAIVLPPLITMIIVLKFIAERDDHD